MNSAPLVLFLILFVALTCSAYFGMSVTNLETFKEGAVSGNAAAGGGTIDPQSIKDLQDSLNALLSKTNSGNPVDDNPLSNYYNWSAFWNTVANSNDLKTAMKSSNFIPKTAVIPPVCPTCTQCAGGSCGGVCNNCGGNGGSGTNSGSGNRFSDYLGSQGGGGGSGGGGRGGGRGGIPGSDGERAYQLAQDAGSGTVGFARDVGEAGLGVLAVGSMIGAGAVQGGVGLAKDTVSGGVGLAKDTVSGGVGLAKETVGGAIGLAREAGTGVASVLQSHPTQIGGPNSGGQGQGTSPGQGASQGQGTSMGLGQGQGTRGNMIDPYSYNGALVSKGGNYIPITTDFSAFAK